MIFTKLEHFNKNENWGDYRKMNGMLLVLLDKITDAVKKYSWSKYHKVSGCIVHCGYDENGHVSKSKHYTGCAVDFHFTVVTPLEAYDIIIEVLEDYNMLNHTGLGVYPDWANPGFHLDIREPNDSQPDRWSQVIGKYVGVEIGLQEFKQR